MKCTDLKKGKPQPHPAWLNDLMMAVETVLNVHQLLEVILEHSIVSKVRRDSRPPKKQQIKNEIGSHPLLHDIVGVVGHLFHDAEGSYPEKRKQINFLCVHFTDIKHNRALSDLVCLCSLLSLLEGSSDNLETSFKLFFAKKCR